MEVKDRMTLEIKNSMMYVRVDYLAYLGYTKEESETDPVKIVVEAQILEMVKRYLLSSVSRENPRPLVVG